MTQSSPSASIPGATVPVDPAPVDPATANAAPDADQVSFPRMNARTQRFTLGEPRNVTVVGSGEHVLFVRTPSGTDRTGMLWSFDVATGEERLLADPRELLGSGTEELSDEERSRRERARESGGGIISFTVDEDGTAAVFALSGDIWLCDLSTGETRQLGARGPVIDPRIDPTGRRIAYASQGELRIVEIDGSNDRALAGPDPNVPADEHVVWGQAEFIAAEEMGRYRGFWWAPDGESLLVERYDNAPVRTWYIADPAHPDRQPAAHRYPAAGTPNAEVSLWHVQLDGARREIPWDHAEFPYLASVSWRQSGAVFQVLSRLQTHALVYRVPAPTCQAASDQAATAVAQTATGQAATEQPLIPELLSDRRQDRWIELVPGLPTLDPRGALIDVRDDDTAGPHGTRRLTLDGLPISPADWYLRQVRAVTERGVIAVVSTDTVDQQLARVGYDGTAELLTSGTAVHTGATGGDTTVIGRTSVTEVGLTYEVRRDEKALGTLASVAAQPQQGVDAVMLTVGERELRATVQFPRGHQPGSAKLPVIMSPYGGPGAQRVLAAGRMFLQTQWLADQGFVVIVADGRGSPGRGPRWEHEIADEFASVTLQDQVDALAAVAQRYPDDVDTSRVGIMGWSFGGYLAALAVLDRPDVFHAAVAGAPVTDWELYDTCYTERYLGLPQERPDVYQRNSLLTRAGQLARPLMIVHGLADDNVVVAHVLRLSSALLAAGKRHHVLPLTGITHMPSDEVVAENLLLAQVEFLRSALGSG